MADKKEKKEKTEKTKFSEKLSSFLEKNRRIVLAVFSVVIVAFVAYVVVFAASSKSNEKTLALVDQISYELTNGSYGLEDTELSARRTTAKNALEPLLSKGGVGGVRANMLMAEIAYQEKDYSKAIECWEAAANKGKKSYTAPLAYFNIASCYEQTGKTDDAATYYKKSADTDEFVLKPHALFSYGRVLETLGKYAEAADAYNSLNDSYPSDVWANLAKTRLIDLKIQGKIEK